MTDKGADVSSIDLEAIAKDSFKCGVKSCIWSSFDYCFRPLFELEVKENQANSLECRFYERYIPLEEEIVKEYAKAIKTAELKQIIETFMGEK